MNFLLDLSNVKDNKLPDLIPCETGNHQKDIDVIESLIFGNEEIEARIYQLIATGKNYDTSIPIGLNIKDLPVGSILIAVEDFDGIEF